MSSETSQTFSRQSFVKPFYKISAKKAKIALLLMVKRNSGPHLTFSRLQSAIFGPKGSVLQENHADLPMAMKIFVLHLLIKNSRRNLSLRPQCKTSFLSTTKYFLL